MSAVFASVDAIVDPRAIYREKDEMVQAASDKYIKKIYELRAQIEPIQQQIDKLQEEYDASIARMDSYWDALAKKPEIDAIVAVEPEV